MRDRDFYEVELEADIYSAGFITFLKSNSPKKLDRMALKCFWTFVFQILLVNLLFYNYAIEKTTDGMRFKGFFHDIFVGDPSLNLSRIICSFLLHVSVLPEIRSAKDMISFSKKNIGAFSNNRFEYPMMFGFFKLTGGLFCFFANIFLCVYSDNIVDVVKDFVAVQVISCVDNIMLGTITADDSIGLPNMKLSASKKRMMMTDAEIWKNHIVPFYSSKEEDEKIPVEQSKKARETGEYMSALNWR